MGDGLSWLRLVIISHDTAQVADTVIDRIGNINYSIVIILNIIFYYENIF